jgi:drug/metabolite transporter (DMT)-like permease
LFALMGVIWGIPYLLIRVAVRDVTPGTLVFARTIIGGLVLLPFALRAGGFRPVLQRWKPLLAFTAIEVAGPWLLLGDAETKLSSSLTGLLVAAVPFMGVLVARVTGSDEKMNATRAAGLLLGIVGVAMLVGVDVGSVHARPLVEIAFVTIGYAVGPVIMDRSFSDIPSIPVVSATMLLCAAGYLPYAATHRPDHLHAKPLLSILTLGVVCTAVAFVTFFALIAEIGPTRSTVITYVNPAVALLLGIALLGEDFTLGMAIGFPLILVGSVLGARKKTVPEGAGIEECVADSVDADEAVRGVEHGRDDTRAVLRAEPVDLDPV